MTREQELLRLIAELKVMRSNMKSRGSKTTLTETINLIRTVLLSCKEPVT